MKHHLFIFLFLLSTIVAYAQPPNDYCYTATPLILNNGNTTFSGTTTGATASNFPVIYPDNCLTPLAPVEDVWYKFNTGSIYFDYTLEIKTDLPEILGFDVMRGVCNAPPAPTFVLTVGCFYDSTSSCHSREIVLTGLDPNTDYYIRVVTGNPVSFSGSMAAFSYTSVVLDSSTTGTIDTSCSKAILDSGSDTSGYSPNEDFTYTIAPADTHNRILFKTRSYYFQPYPSIDGLYFYKGDSVHVDSLVMTIKNSGSFEDTTFIIETSGNITMRFQSDSFNLFGNYEVYYECLLYNPFDVGVTDIQKNDSYCVISTVDTISVVVQNFGLDTVSNFPVSYQVYGNPMVTEMFLDTLPPCSNTIFTFTQTVNLAKSWNSGITAWTSLSSDADIQNDTTHINLDCICYDSLGTPYVCNQFVIQYTDSATAAEIQQIRQDILNTGGYIIDSINCDGFALDRGVLPDTINWFGSILIGTESQVEGLKTSTAKIKEADLNFLSNSADAGFEWHKSSVQAINSKKHISRAESSKNITTSSSPVKIVILDTGADFARIPSSMVSTINCETCSGLPLSVREGYDYINLDSIATDDNGHGTNVISVITDIANTEGFSDLSIIPLKVLDHEGEGSLWEILLGTVTAKLVKADIINASFGWLGTESEILYEAISILDDDCHGVFIASAGNESNNNDIVPHHPSDGTRFYNNIVSVGATNTSLSLAGYSNYGELSVDVAAPGTLLDSIGSIIGEGTSYAAPYVTSYVAKKMIENEHLSESQVKACIDAINAYGFSPLVNSAGTVLINSTLNHSTVLAFENCLDTSSINTGCVIRTCLDSTVNVVEPKINVLQFTAAPNPFSDEVRFNFYLEKTQSISLRIIDLNGRTVHEHLEPVAQGEHQIIWNGSQLPKGIYFCHAQTETGYGILKLILL